LYNKSRTYFISRAFISFTSDFPYLSQFHHRTQVILGFKPIVQTFIGPFVELNNHFLAKFNPIAQLDLNLTINLYFLDAFSSI